MKADIHPKYTDLNVKCSCGNTFTTRSTGGKNSELTPFVKGGANYLLRKRLLDGKEIWSNKRELGLTASAGILLNLAKNVGLSAEAEYNFEKGTAVEDIDTKQLMIKFGIRSFLGE